MKSFLATMLVLCFVVFNAEAKELSVAGVISDGEIYAGKAVIVRGDFLYTEPGRESFTIGQGNSTVEVFYRDLPGNDKVFLLSRPMNSKLSILVSGMLRQYANRERHYFIDATSVKYEGAAPAPVAGANVVTLFDIQSNPAKYVTKPVTMKGLFLYSDPMRQSFTFEQNNDTMEVIVSDLSKLDRDRILEQRKNSKIPVTVTGLLQKYANDEKRFFITAYTLTLGN